MIGFNSKSLNPRLALGALQPLLSTEMTSHEWSLTIGNSMNKSYQMNFLCLSTDILQALTGAQWLSTFDALAGFTQLEMLQSNPLSTSWLRYSPSPPFDHSDFFPEPSHATKSHPAPLHWSPSYPWQTLAENGRRVWEPVEFAERVPDLIRALEWDIYKA